MADRIFPNSNNVDMGSKIQFSGIDWSEVETNIKKAQAFENEEDNTSQIMELISKLTNMEPEEIAGLVDEAKQMSGGSQDMSQDMSHGTPSPSGGDMAPPDGGGGGPDYVSGEEDSSDESMPSDHGSNFGGSDDGPPSFGGDSGDDSVESGHDKPMGGGSTPPWKMSSGKNTMKKIAFTHPDQISAAAIEKAIAAKDEHLVKTILAARKENRNRIKNAIEAKIQKEAQSKSTAKVASSAPVATLDFTSPAKFTSAQREAFNKIAVSLGMPEQYVSAMCEPTLSEPVVALNQKIKEVYASTISEDVKATIVTHLLKEAKLSPDSKSEFINFWNNILGYQDKDFWPMVAADYDDGKKVK